MPNMTNLLERGEFTPSKGKGEGRGSRRGWHATTNFGTPRPPRQVTLFG